ncbi:MAG: hypothetical protein LBE97_02405 [Holosporales bacterium]|jgi:hypothetical protein|nr:hypothetical protein [Holosporales bacterium]
MLKFFITHLQVISAVLLGYAFNCILHFAMEDKLGLLLDKTVLFDYEYAKCMSCMTVSGIIFLLSTYFKNKKSAVVINKNETEKKLFARILLISILICAIQH